MVILKEGEGPGLIKEISNADYVPAWQKNMALDIKRMPFIPFISYLVVLMHRFTH